MRRPGWAPTLLQVVAPSQPLFSTRPLGRVENAAGKPPRTDRPPHDRSGATVRARSGRVDPRPMSASPVRDVLRPDRVHPAGGGPDPADAAERPRRAGRLLRPRERLPGVADALRREVGGDAPPPGAGPAAVAEPADG